MRGGSHKLSLPLLSRSPPLSLTRHTSHLTPFAHSVPSDKAGQWNSVRLMLAGMNILYYSLFGGDMEDAEWAR